MRAPTPKACPLCGGAVQGHELDVYAETRRALWVALDKHACDEDWSMPEIVGAADALLDVLDGNLDESADACSEPAEAQGSHAAKRITLKAGIRSLRFPVLDRDGMHYEDHEIPEGPPGTRPVVWFQERRPSPPHWAIVCIGYEVGGGLR